MPAISRLGDEGIHIGSGETGTITSVSSVDVVTMGPEPIKPVALEGDMYTCSISEHGTNPLIAFPTQVDTTSLGKRLITVGSRSSCGATIIQGYSQAITLPPAPPIVVSPYVGSTSVDTLLIIPNTTLISSGLDLDLLPIVLQSVQDPVNGTVSMTPPGFVTFTPNILYVGPASFSYTLSSVNGTLSPITANITVTL